MTPKKKRERLFGKRRPQFRPIQLFDNGRYHKDVGLLWVSYTRKPLYWFPKDLNQQQFAELIEKMVKAKSVLIAEDYNGEYQGVGPIAFVTIDTDGWKIIPHAEYFSWATPKNKLRAAVAFFQWVRHQNIGACVVHSLKDSKPLFDKCADYGVLHYVGRVVNGDPRGDEYIYSVRGTKCQDPAQEV